MTDPTLNLAPADRAVDYARVSTDFQEKKQISVPAQHRENREFIFKRNWLLVREFHDEGISGETLERPGLQALLTFAREGALPENGATLVKKAVTRNAHLDVVVVWKLDRLTRPDDDDDLDFLLLRRELRRCGVALESVTEPWVGGAFQVDGSGMDQFMGYLGRGQTKVEKITREARFDLGRRQIAEAQGRQNGPPPYGYDWRDPAAEDGSPLPRAAIRRGRAWVPIQPAADWVQFIFAQSLAGHGTPDIVQELNLRQALPPSLSGDGKRRLEAIGQAAPGEWHHDAVLRILRNRRYAGWVYHRKSATWHSTYEARPADGDPGRLKPGGHPALITDEAWQAVQRILDGRGKQRSATADALFAGGLLACPRCAAKGRETAMLVITRHALRTLSTGETKRYRWVAYACGVADRAKKRGRVGLLVAEEHACENFEIGQKTVLPLLLAYLRRLARALSPADVIRLQRQAGEKAQAEAGRALLLRAGASEGRDVRKGQRAEMEKQLAQIPLMETNFQMQQAQGLMSMEKLRSMLDGLRVREASLTAALAEAEEDKVEEALTPQAAAYLLSLLEDDAAPPLQKRDALNATFRRLMVGLDRKSLTVWLK